MNINGIIFFGIAEVIIFAVLIYFIVKADIFINALHEEVKDISFCLAEIVKDIKYDLRAINAEISESVLLKSPSPEQIGMIVSKIFTEIIMFRLSSLQFAKKYAILPVIFKHINRPLKTKIVYRSMK
jgi:hypothetical protein